MLVANDNAMTEKQNTEENYSTKGEIEVEKDAFMENVLFTTNHPSDKYPVEKSFNQLWARIQSNPEHEAKIQKILPWRYVAAVASVALLFAVSYLYVNRQINHQEVYTLAADVDKRQFTLPDGTVVWLNSGSRLIYTDAFGSEKRELNLDGEAYFDVAKDPQRPFVVKAGSINVQALGTIFNVKAYPNDSIIATTLIEGSVAVSSTGDGLHLSPGQQLLFNSASKYMTFQEVEEDVYTAWKDGLIIFRQTSIKEAITIMERAFRTTIILKNENISKRKITGRFNMDRNPEAILDVMKEALLFSYRIEDGIIYIE